MLNGSTWLEDLKLELARIMAAIMAAFTSIRTYLYHGGLRLFNHGPTQKADL
jgi:hypothetical protein